MNPPSFLFYFLSIIQAFSEFIIIRGEIAWFQNNIFINFKNFAFISGISFDNVEKSCSQEFTEKISVFLMDSTTLL